MYDVTRDAITHEVQTAISRNQQGLLNNLTELINSKLDTFKRSITRSQKEISNDQVNRIEEKITDNYTFCRKGNENQYRHESKVLAKLKESKSSLDKEELDLDSVDAAKSAY
ncbi:hypothetical protein SNE40_003013 [Patella caerulea]|uniref:Uncharacterized protein n=1 Tax=Patella caerulea TaxID=87958 RepID=A0AAN8PZU8_PATCE